MLPHGLDSPAGDVIAAAPLAAGRQLLQAAPSQRLKKPSHPGRRPVRGAEREALLARLSIKRHAFPYKDISAARQGHAVGPGVVRLRKYKVYKDTLCRLQAATVKALRIRAAQDWQVLADAQRVARRERFAAAAVAVASPPVLVPQVAAAPAPVSLQQEQEAKSTGMKHPYPPVINGTGQIYLFWRRCSCSCGNAGGAPDADFCQAAGG